MIYPDNIPFIKWYFYNRIVELGDKVQIIMFILSSWQFNLWSRIIFKYVDSKLCNIMHHHNWWECWRYSDLWRAFFMYPRFLWLYMCPYSMYTHLFEKFCNIKNNNKPWAVVSKNSKFIFKTDFLVYLYLLILATLHNFANKMYSK